MGFVQVDQLTYNMILSILNVFIFQTIVINILYSSGIYQYRKYHTFFLRLYAFHVQSMQVRVLLRLWQSVHDGSKMLGKPVLRKAGPSRSSSTELSVLSSR